MSPATGFIHSFTIIVLGGARIAAFLVFLRVRDAQEKSRMPRGRESS